MSVGCQRDVTLICLPYEQMKEGDLAFRCGYGLSSRAVKYCEDKCLYSHVGILVSDDGEWRVIHAVPGEKENDKDFARVKNESIEQFFHRSRAYKGCLVHPGIQLPEAIAIVHNKALKYANDSVRFDSHYDLNDSSKVYCSEFVWLLYKDVGVDLSEGRRRFIRAFNIKADCLLPEHILEYSNNISYFSF